MLAILPLKTISNKLKKQTTNYFINILNMLIFNKERNFMSDTPRTLSQLPQDTNSLLRQLVVMVENLAESTNEIKADIRRLDQRVAALETSRDTVGKLDKLVATVAEFGQELNATKSQFQQEMTAFRVEVQQSIAALETRFHQDIEALRSEVHQDIESLRNDFDQKIEALRMEVRQELAVINNSLAEYRKETRDSLRKIERNTHKLNSELAETILRVDDLEDIYSKKN